MTWLACGYGKRDTQERLRLELDVLIRDVCMVHAPKNWQAQYAQFRNAIDATITSGRFTVPDWIHSLERCLDEAKEKQK